MLRLVRLCAGLTLAVMPIATASPQAASRLRFAVTFPAARSASPIDGRLIVLLAADSSSEPRFQFTSGPNTDIGFAIDVEGWKPGEVRYVDGTAFGFPIASLKDLPRGRYHVQAIVNRYETFTLGDGRTLKLPPDKGEGQHWNAKPGNLYSKPQGMAIDPARGGTVAVALDQEIGPMPPPKETKYVKYVRVKSDRLTKFWGRDTYIAAFVTLPWGFDEHPDARYPLVVNHGHFPYEPDYWREEPPDPNLAPDYSERFRITGYNRIAQQGGWQLYQDWIGKGFPRMLLVEIQHATPFYDDSYAVNSANNGPYGDAIQYELIPEIERRFRGIGQGWARFLEGGSTGGWESLAVQMFYPDEYNGAWVACPDPIDFRDYTVVNIYEDTAAYYIKSRFKKTPRPGLRDWKDQPVSTLKEVNEYEYVLGTRTRSGEQWDVWESVFSPVGPDGYPARIWDKLTGKIDPKVAEYWKEHYDLSHIMQRDWATLGPKLHGKLRLYVGELDNIYLNLAVMDVEKFLKQASPPADAVVDYGARAEHCWNGDHTRDNGYARLRYAQMSMPWFVERILKSAPPNADVKSWRY